LKNDGRGSSKGMKKLISCNEKQPYDTMITPRNISTEGDMRADSKFKQNFRNLKHSIQDDKIKITEELPLVNRKSAG
jgi:hypothetical protein